MKKLLLMFAAVATLFTACNKETDCGHDFIEHDFSKDIVGTWTYVADNGQAEAMVIKADGSFTTTGVMKGGSLYEEKGTIKVVNNKVTLAFDGDKETFEGRLEFVAGKSLSLVMFDDNATRLTYDYCENDLSDEIVGMWVCHEGLPGVENDMAVVSYSENGKMTMTTQASAFIPADLVNTVYSYVVVGDLLFMNVEEDGIYKYAARLAYTPNGNALGDIFTQTLYTPTENGIVKVTSTFLRVKQHLELPGTKCDYIKTFVTNVKGEDKDIPFLNSSFNFAKMDGSIIDKFLKSTLFAVEFPDANTLKYSFLVDGQSNPIAVPIEVEGNLITIKMSENGPYQDVEIYTFQDQDNTQMHLYMPTSSFEKFFANTSVHVMLGSGQLSENDTEAIAGVYKTIADAVESINLSLVMSKTK